MDKYERDDRVEELHKEDQKLCNVVSGFDWNLEEIADHILAKGRRGVFKHSELRDHLSNSQLDLRRSREVYPTQGFPEKNIFNGMYKRAYNPLTRGTRTSKATPNLESEPTDHGE